MDEGCKAMVVPYGAWRESQCSRKASKDGYCKQHHPDSVQARRDKRAAKWARDDAVRNAPHLRIIELEAEVETLKAIVAEMQK